MRMMLLVPEPKNDDNPQLPLHINAEQVISATEIVVEGMNFVPGRALVERIVEITMHNGTVFKSYESMNDFLVRLDIYA